MSRSCRKQLFNNAKSWQVTSEIAKQFRSQKTSLGFSPGARPDAFIRHSDETSLAQVDKLKNQISRMAGFGFFELGKEVLVGKILPFLP